MKGLHETAVRFGNLVTWMAAVDLLVLAEPSGQSDQYTSPVLCRPIRLSSNRRAAPWQSLPSDIAKLETMLRYHVVVGKIPTGEMTQLACLRTLLGDELIVNAKKGLRINQAKLVSPNIHCRNGLIHTIDDVLLLRSMPSCH